MRRWVVLGLTLAMLSSCAPAKKSGIADTSGMIGDLCNYDSPPKLLKAVRPEYPDIAREIGTEGKVILKAVILEDGTVGQVQVLESPHPVFEGNAIEALRRSTFLPATYAGAPVKATVVIPFLFKLDRGATSLSPLPDEEAARSGPGRDDQLPLPPVPQEPVNPSK